MKHGGYTWGRQQCQSRLDYIFISTYLATKMVGIDLDWAFENSDHASVMVSFSFESVTKGPGLIRLNTAVLDDPAQLASIKLEIREMLEQIPSEWNPHQNLEFLKMVIRTIA